MPPKGSKIAKGSTSTLNIGSSNSSTSVNGGHWVACDKCEKWRLLPLHVNIEELTTKTWTCSENLWDTLHNTCEAPEEAWSATPGADGIADETMTTSSGVKRGATG